MKLVYEDLNSFVRNQDPKKTLNLGYEAKIREFFRSFDIPDKDYYVEEDGKIVLNSYLYLVDTNVTELPDNLTVNGFLNLSGTNIIKLPNNLTVNSWIDLKNTQITYLPDDLIVKKYIYVIPAQIELIDFVKQSKFAQQLYIL